MSNQMPSEMEKELQGVLEDMQTLEAGLWKLITMTDAVIHCSQIKAARKIANDKLKTNAQVSTPS